MKCIYSCLFFVFSIIFFSSQAYAIDKSEAYCIVYEEIKQINYWANINISISDYKANSNDSEYLNLLRSGPDFKNTINNDLKIHFEKEFTRLIKGGLPFHDTQKGVEKRFSDFYDKYSNHSNRLQMFEAQEEARRNSLFGQKPGALYCTIHIDRREFPVLYEMKCSIVANNKLRNVNGLVESKLGYSSPELIIGELKHSITEQLEALNQILKIIQNCK